MVKRKKSKMKKKVKVDMTKSSNEKSSRSSKSSSSSRSAKTPRRATPSKITTPLVASSGIFLPDYPEQVKAVAMRGLTDDEMAAVFGISSDLMDSWKKYYPGFSKAIEEGRTAADANVVRALYENAVGFEYDEDEIVRTRHGGEILTVHKKKLPETNAIKFWLENRQPRHWASSVRIGGERPPGHNGPYPIGLAVKAETKVEVMNSILNMITPKPDPVPKS